ncbi:lamin tail domain-containing protein [Reichenbachiella sp. MALMAid0571]|uniref:lamin tail domain-containing protein n=1 Tax=Reichenbachiella sp. MALMAid0571 TaxID=3143939 RepID=UPI0032DF1421
MKFLIPKVVLVVFLTLSPFVVKAQFNEDFSDGDFTNNPVWSGDVGEFEIESTQLNSNGPDETSVLFLSTPSSIFDQAIWEFLIDLRFAPSGSNKVRVYLASNQENLETDLDGYYIEIGQSNEDYIKFFRHDANGTETLLFTGSTSFSGNVKARIQVKRDCIGNWEINADSAGGTEFLSEGASFLDDTYTTTSYFGFVCFHTKTNAAKFYFDDISIYGDLAVSLIAVESASSIKVTFNKNVEEISAETISNYSINNGITINSVTRDVDNQNEVLLIVSALSSSDYELTISAVADECNTPLATPIVQNFQYLQLELESVATISETELQLTFNDDLEEASAETVANYNIDNSIGQSNSVTLDQDDTKVAILRFDSPFQPLTNYTLTYGNLENGIGNSEVTAGSTIQFEYIIPLAIESLEVLSKSEIELTFNLELDEVSSQVLNNYFLDNEIGNPSLAILNNVNSKKVNLIFDSDFQQADYTLTVNNVQDGGNHSIEPNTTASFSYLPLSIIEITVIDETTIGVIFNQNIDQVSVETLDNYVVDFNIGTPETAVLDGTDANKIHLTFATSFVNNDYVLTVGGVENASKNAIAESISKDFEIISPTESRQIVINEIFADPTPEIGLPNAEFVELYNTTEKAINIGGFELTGGEIPDFVLNAKSYVILTAISDVTAFETFGDVIGVTSWNTLINGGEPVLLMDNLNNLVDSITFSSDWYESEKSDGGWTLEQINPELVCNYQGNWSSSTNTSGGTPGAQNSNYDNSSDVFGPNLIAVEALNESTLKLTFNEPIDQASFISANYAISEGSTMLEVASINPSYLLVMLVLEQNLISGKGYEISVSGVKDCTGNAIVENTLTLNYDIEPPNLERIVINSLNKIELFFDEPLEEKIAETESNYTLGTESENPTSAILGENPSRIQLTFENEFKPLEAVELTIENLKDIKENALVSAIVSNFTYDQAIDTVMVKSINQLDIRYSENIDPSTTLNKLNYSVDNEVGNPSLVYVDQTDENLFHLLFENNLDDNKVLILSTTDIKNTSGEFVSTPEYSFVYDTRPPKVKSLTVTNSNTLEVWFDEKVEKVSAQSVENYYYDEYFSTSRVLNENDSTVILEFASDFEPEVTFELIVDNVKDISGNEIATRIRTPFTYDIFPPQLDSIIVFSESELTLVFSESLEKISATSVDNFLIGEIGNPETVTIDLENQNIVRLTFNGIFPEVSDIPITISNLTDQRENTLIDPVQTTFDYQSFYISKISTLSVNQLEIVFNKTPNEIDLNVLSNTTLNHEQNPASIEIDPINHQKVSFTFPNSIEDNSNNFLEVKNIHDENENLMVKSEYGFFFDSRFSSMKILNANTLEIAFEVGIDKSSLIETNTFEVTPDFSFPILVIPDQEDNKVVRLVFEKEFINGVNYTLDWGMLTNEFGNMIPAFVAEFSKDEVAPVATEVTVISKQSLNVSFSEPLNNATTDILSNYLVEGIGKPITVKYLSESNTVSLTFDGMFQGGVSYNLSLSNIKDLSGNVIEETILSFTYIAPYIPKSGELLITEIMADPSPSVGLPDVEYLEIYNNSNQKIVLDQIQLSDRTSQTLLSGYSLLAGQYLILTSTSNALFFENQNVLGIANFPSLGNSEDSLVLSVAESEIILDQVVYSSDWYRDETKKDGGYSIERLSLGEKCLPGLNWIASDDTSGGTPGRENSLFNTEPDQSVPEVVKIEFVSDVSMEISFNEPMDFESMIIGNFTFSGGLTIDQIQAFGQDKSKLTLILEQALIEGQLDTLRINNVTDCAGNAIESYSFPFGKGAKPKFNELLITEIMADPDPEVGLPQTEYLEIYNASDKNIELSGLILRDENSETSLPTKIMLSHSYLVLVPSGSADLFSGINILSVGNWLSLSNGGEQISIYEAENLVFSLTYQQSWYKDSNKKDGGWSLEMIDTNNPCGEENNWTASIDLSGGTPGKENSVSTPNPDNLGPQLIEAIAKPDKKVELIFDEKLNPNQFINGFFTIDPQLTIDEIVLHKVGNKNVSLTFSDEISPKVVYAIEAENFNDCVGNMIRSESNSVEFVLPEQGVAGDIVLNEILFNPRSGGVDFVEVYNKSDKAINLKNWQLANYNSAGEIDADKISVTDYVFLPHTFLVFTSNATTLKADYPSGDESTFLEMSPFPAYADSQGSVILLDSLDNVIDLFDYDSDFHFALLDKVDGVSLERISFDGATNDPNNWKSAASTVGFATPGLMNSQFKTESQISGTLSIEPKVFMPDNTGVNDFTTISYDLQNAGTFANVNVYDPVGRLVKTLAQGDLLSTSGFFTWDGTDNRGSRARAGYYAIYFEFFDANGNKEIMKETVVLGTRF